MSAGATRTPRRGAARFDLAALVDAVDLLFDRVDLLFDFGKFLTRLIGRDRQ